MTEINDTIIAQATAPGRGGVGIIRVSGKQASQVAKQITLRQLRPRHAHYLTFWDASGEKIDQGIALFFPGPNSFTGEDVLELQGHGGPAVMQMLLKVMLNLPGIRMAHPGEFSERAFLNDKIDLVQAEAIADLIEANSESAAKSALASLQGEFSKQVDQLVEALIQLRMYVEAAIDFPEEEIDFLSDGKVATDLEQICLQLDRVCQSAQRGAILREGMKIVIVGRPNAGKSSLLNALSGKDSAIVTDIAGTTRDVLTEHIHIDGMPLHIIDTAGLRHAKDQVEKIGIERAWREMQQADRILFIHDATASTAQTLAEFQAELNDHEQIKDWPDNVGISLIRNKIDSTNEEEGIETSGPVPLLRLSAKTGQGMDVLREHLKACIGFDNNTEGHYMARQRHLDALAQAQQHLATGKRQLTDWLAGEILAEELRLAQQSLDQISGQFHSDELLGRIFSSFCIGK